PAVELEQVLADFRTLRARKPALADVQVVGNVMAELRRAKRTEEADKLYHEEVEAAKDPSALGPAIALATERRALDTLLKLIARSEAVLGNNRYTSGGLADHVTSLVQIMSTRADEKKHAEALAILDQYLDWDEKPERIARRQKTQATSQPFQGQQNYS